MQKLKGFMYEAVLFVCLFVIWAVCGLEVLDD